jgi:AraC-like DNA-binding protein
MTWSLSISRGIDHRIRKAVKIMRDECKNNLDLSELASSVGLSRSRFYQQFRSCVGVTPRLYLDTLRCELIIRLFANQNKTLAEISDELAFSNQAHFTRFFKSKTGILLLIKEVLNHILGDL